jgi:hypothetical protein
VLPRGCCCCFQRHRKRRTRAKARRATKAAIDATVMPALKAVVWTIGTGRPGAEEVAEAVAAVVGVRAVEEEVAVLIAEGAGEHVPNTSWHPASQ